MWASKSCEFVLPKYIFKHIILNLLHFYFVFCTIDFTGIFAQNTAWIRVYVTRVILSYRFIFSASGWYLERFPAMAFQLQMALKLQKLRLFTCWLFSHGGKDGNYGKFLLVEPLKRKYRQCNFLPFRQGYGGMKFNCHWWKKMSKVSLWSKLKFLFYLS